MVTAVEAYANQIQIAASSGAGLVSTELVTISAQGRITPDSAGIYHADHVEMWKRVVDFIHGYTLRRSAIQLNHAGRRGSTDRGQTDWTDRCKETTGRYSQHHPYLTHHLTSFLER